MDKEENKINSSALGEEGVEPVSYEERGFSNTLEESFKRAEKAGGIFDKGAKGENETEEKIEEGEEHEDEVEEGKKQEVSENVSSFHEDESGSIQVKARKIEAEGNIFERKVREAIDEMLDDIEIKTEKEKLALKQMRNSVTKILEKLSADFVKKSNWKKRAKEDDNEYVHAGNLKIKIREYLGKVTEEKDLFGTHSHYKYSMLDILSRVAGEKNDAVKNEEDNSKDNEEAEVEVGKSEKDKSKEEPRRDTFSGEEMELDPQNSRIKKIEGEDLEQAKRKAEEGHLIDDREKKPEDNEENSEEVDRPEQSDETNKEKSENSREAEDGSGLENIIETAEANREQTVEDLIREVEEARSIYADMEQKKIGKWQSVSSYFKGFLKKSSVESDPELLECKQKYKEALNRYRNKRLEALRGEFKEKKGPDGKVIKVNLKGNEDFEKKSREIFEYFNYEEVLSLYDARTDAKIESMKGTKMEVVSSGLRKMHDFYSGLSIKSKLVIAVGTMSAGYALAVPGVASLLLARRLAGGVIAGYGAAKTLDALAQAQLRRSAKRESDRNVSEFLRDSQSYWDNIEARLQFDLDGVDKKMNGLKVKSYFNKAFGAAIGLTIGASGFAKASEAFDFSSEIKTGPVLVEAEIENGDVRLDIENSSEDSPVENSTDKKIKEIPEDFSNNSNETEIIPENKEKVAASLENIEENFTKLTVREGSSLEGTLIEYIKDHKSEIFDHHPELKEYDAGQIAHRMTVDFMEENRDKFPQGIPNLIHPGAEVRINPASLEIESVYDEQVMSENLDGTGSSTDFLGGSSEDASASILESQEKVENQTESETMLGDKITNEGYNEASQGLDNIISKADLTKLNKVNFTEVISPQKSFLDNTINLQKQLAAMVPDSALGGGRASELDKWNMIKEFEAKELERSDRLKKMFGNFYISMSEYGILEKEIRPIQKESLRQWTGRIVKKIMSS